MRVADGPKFHFFDIFLKFSKFLIFYEYIRKSYLLIIIFEFSAFRCINFDVSLFIFDFLKFPFFFFAKECFAPNLHESVQIISSFASFVRSLARTHARKINAREMLGRPFSAQHMAQAAVLATGGHGWSVSR